MDILKQVIDKELSDLQFEGYGYYWVGKREGLEWLVACQSSRRDESEVTFNAGIYIPNLLNAYLRRPDQITPEIGMCVVSVRLGMLDSSRLDRWWKIGELSESDIVELRRRFRSHLLPFFRRFETIDSLAQFLLKKREGLDKFIYPQSDVLSLLYGALVLEKKGDIVAACKAMSEAIDKSKGSPLDLVLARFSKGLSWFTK